MKSFKDVIAGATAEFAHGQILPNIAEVAPKITPRLNIWIIKELPLLKYVKINPNYKTLPPDWSVIQKLINFYTFTIW